MNTHNAHNNDTRAESSSYLAATAGQNAQDEPTAESRSAPAAEAGREPQAGGGSAPSLCSALGAPDNQVAKLTTIPLIQNEEVGYNGSLPVSQTDFAKASQLTKKILTKRPNKLVFLFYRSLSYLLRLPRRFSQHLRALEIRANTYSLFENGYISVQDIPGGLPRRVKLNCK